MISFFRWGFSIILTVLVILFAVANRGLVDVVWSPVHTAVAVPVFLLVLGGAVAGFLSGGLSVWLNAAELRQERRKQRSSIRKLEKQVQVIDGSE